MSPAGTRRPLDVALAGASVAAALGVLALMALRLRYGVDFQDEAYYTALAYRFVLGDRPFVDEMHFLQLAAMLTYPFVKAYVSLSGGTAGIVLFMRALWLLFTLGVCAAGFAFLRGVMRWPLALLACLLPLTAAPFNIPTLSYNSLGAGLLALGMALGGIAVVSGRDRRWLLAAGVAHGFAAWAYPTLALAVLAFGVAIVVLERRGALRPLALYLGGAAGVGAVLAAVLLRAGLGNVAADWRWMATLSDYGGGEGKIPLVFGRAWDVLATQPVLLVALAVALVAGLALPRAGRWVLLVLPLAAVFPVVGLPYARVMWATSLFGLVGVFLGVFIGGRPLARRVYIWAVLPSLAAAFVTAYTSSNGFMNASIGFFPALFATPAMLALVCAPAEEEAPGPRVAALAPWALAVVLLLTVVRLGQYEYRTVYHDGQRQYLTAEVKAGPFAGLRTLPVNERLDAQLSADVERYVKPGDTVLFFDALSAGYLYSAARPAANSLWLSGSDDNVGADRHETIAWWKRTGRYPDVAFHYVYRVRHESRVLAAYVSTPRYRAVEDRGRYRVWVREGR